MHSLLRRFLLVLLALPSLLSAQTKTIPSHRSGEKPPVAQVMAAALTLRTNTAARIANGELTPEAAVRRLRQADTPSGLVVDPEAGLALAVIDIAQRLLVQGKRVEAEALFVEAEKALVSAVQKTPDSAARDKALYLRARAEIRANYLNQPAQAGADIEAALKLQPDNLRLKKLGERIAGKNAELFGEKPRG
jgi:hypothetical protein